MGLSLITLALAKKNTKIAVENAIRIAEAYTDEVASHFISFTVEIVESLPSPSEAKDHVIYFIRRQDPSGESTDYYEEYIWINNAWELIGSTLLDLSNYWTIDQVKEYVQEVAYVLPVATETTLGGIKIDNISIKINNNEQIYVDQNHSENVIQNVIDANFEYISNEDINNLFNS